MPKAKVAKAKVYQPCGRCGERHHHFGKCQDGVKVLKGAKPFEKGNHLGKNAKPETEEPAAPLVVAEVVEKVSPAALAREELRDMIAAMPEDHPQRKAMQLLLDRDVARETHDADEKNFRDATGNADARLPLPNILREQDEKKSRALLGALNQTFAREGVRLQDPSNGRLNAPALKDEATLVHDRLQALPGERDAAQAAARDAAKIPEHFGGDQWWICRNESCGKRFKAASLDQIRRKAKDDPAWRFQCPNCHGGKVELLMLEGVA